MASDSTGAHRFTAGELFCGAGGLSRGFHNTGFESQFANDIWDVALHTFLMNFDEKYAASNGRRSGDVLGLPGSIEGLDASDILSRLPDVQKNRTSETGELDVLLGGPPCQGYSLNAHNRSPEDPRNHLFRHYVRLLHGLSPKVFVLENVPGMFSLDGGRFFDELLTAIRSPTDVRCPGYEIDFKILNAAHYGVPQERFRVVVVGTRRDVADACGKVNLPTPVHYSFAQAHFKGGRSHTFHYAIGYGAAERQTVVPFSGARLISPVTVFEAIGDLPALRNGGGVDLASYNVSGSDLSLTEYQRKMRMGENVLHNHWVRVLFPGNVERAGHIPPGGDWRSIPRNLLPPGMQRALRKDHTSRYGRLSEGQLAGTLLTKPDPHWGSFIHYDMEQQRLISVREAARLQSFPDTHVFYGCQVDQYRLCGNAVPPLMAEAIATNVGDVLVKYYSQLQTRTKPPRTADRTRARAP
jgi:DNA (cytosine-5)-methyltransferase 1